MHHGFQSLFLIKREITGERYKLYKWQHWPDPFIGSSANKNSFAKAKYSFALQFW